MRNWVKGLLKLIEKGKSPQISIISGWVRCWYGNGGDRLKSSENGLKCVKGF
jgi:hypothetical protein